MVVGEWAVPTRGRTIVNAGGGEEGGGGEGGGVMGKGHLVAVEVAAAAAAAAPRGKRKAYVDEARGVEEGGEDAHRWGGAEVTRNVWRGEEGGGRHPQR